jgi:N-methylhydantoinase A
MTVQEPANAQSFLAVDIGGTFTDIVVARSDGRFHRAKVLSTFDELLNGIEAGLREVLSGNEIRPEAVATVVHASTVGTNTILEQKGAVTGLLTTSGFRDVLEIGRLRRPSLYDIFWEKPPPLVRRSLRREVAERVRADGGVEVPLDEAGALDEVAGLRERGVESLAVCFLHSYANPSHELAVGAAIRRRHPELLVSLSHEILPEPREFERTSTTVINAYILPAVDRYLERFGAVLGRLGITAPVFMMQSNGGTIPAGAARRRPVSIVESGPAAGALATGFMATQLGLANAIAFDMGGTTAKASVVRHGVPEMSFEYEVGAGINAANPLLRGGGYALRGPTISIAEVGSGGGSIAWVDEGGAVQVGPQSAGADPGPACYGLGGVAPTVTDANVVLGYISPTSIAGGRLPIHPERAAQAVRDHVAAPLGLSLEQAAYGVHAVAIENMARAVRAVTVERGRDPREFTLVAFGGSGPVHAAGLAQSIGIATVVIPIAAGLFSALGLLFSDVRHDFVATVAAVLDEVDEGVLLQRFRDLETRAQSELATWDGIEAGARTEYSADVRYAGQSSELTVDLGSAGAGLRGRIAERFVGEYTRLYGRPGTGAIELVSVRLTTRAPVRRVDYRDLGVPDAARDEARPAEERRSYWPGSGTVVAPIVPGRHAIPPSGLQGPAVVEETDTTILVPPGCRASVDTIGNVVLDVR